MKLRISNLIFLYFGLALIGISGFFFTLFVSKPVGFYAFIIAAALGGFGVASNIFFTKRSKRQLVCPTGSNCNAVVNSRYSRFFGISLEYWGMAYFAVVIISYSILILAPEILFGLALVLLMLLTFCAGIFSSYLLFVQAFLLRQWCIWCILAAFMSLTVFLVSLISLQPAIAFLAEIENFIQFLRFLGFALGVGGASSAVFMFFRFLRDLEIDDHELKVINSIFELVWIGFGMTLVGQLAIYVIYSEALSASGVFIGQTLVLFIAALSGGVLMIIYAPFLVFVPFQKAQELSRASFVHLRLPTVIVGSIALGSWYFSFALNFIPSITFSSLIISYSIFIVLFSSGAILWEKGLVEKTLPAKE